MRLASCRDANVFLLLQLSKEQAQNRWEVGYVGAELGGEMHLVRKVLKEKYLLIVSIFSGNNVVD